jgi:type II secretory pathway pseudopilin PulG
MEKISRKNNKGFTIVESLVAISLLVISIAGPLSLAAKGIGYSSYARDEITAFYLANEALDVIRYIRDTNTSAGGPDSWLNLPGSDNDQMVDNVIESYYFDVWQNPIKLQKTSRDNLRQDTLLEVCKTSTGINKFGYFRGVSNCTDGAIEDSIFSRRVTLKPIKYSDSRRVSEIEVTVIVNWTANNGIEREVSVTENLFNLWPI